MNFVSFTCCNQSFNCRTDGRCDVRREKAETPNKSLQGRKMSDKDTECVCVCEEEGVVHR